MTTNEYAHGKLTIPWAAEGPWHHPFEVCHLANLFFFPALPAAYMTQATFWMRVPDLSHLMYQRINLGRKLSDNSDSDSTLISVTQSELTPFCRGKLMAYNWNGLGVFLPGTVLPQHTKSLQQKPDSVSREWHKNIWAGTLLWTCSAFCHWWLRDFFSQGCPLCI